jgi:hypothetical protein
MKFGIFILSIAVGIGLLSYGTHIQDPLDIGEINYFQYGALGCIGIAILLWQDLN